MKTFLKVLLGVFLAIVAIKLLPVALIVVLATAGFLAVAGIVGLSAVAGIFCAALLIIAVLSPLWLPVLAILGIIALIRRSSARPA